MINWRRSEGREIPGLAFTAMWENTTNGQNQPHQHQRFCPYHPEHASVVPPSYAVFGQKGGFEAALGNSSQGGGCFICKNNDPPQISLSVRSALPASWIPLTCSDILLPLTHLL